MADVHGEVSDEMMRDSDGSLFIDLLDLRNEDRREDELKDEFDEWEDFYRHDVCDHCDASPFQCGDCPEQ